MGRGGDSVNKRRVTAQRNDRKKIKDEKRKKRSDDLPTGRDQQTDLMDRFHRINELRVSGAITQDEFEEQRQAIFDALGLEAP
jgi:hypothetical protein